MRTLTSKVHRTTAPTLSSVQMVRSSTRIRTRNTTSTSAPAARPRWSRSGRRVETVHSTSLASRASRATAIGSGSPPTNRWSPATTIPAVRSGATTLRAFRAAPRCSSRPGPAGGPPSHHANFEYSTPDGAHVSSARAERLTSSDTDNQKPDVYERSGGATTLVSTGPGDTGMWPPCVGSHTEALSCRHPTTARARSSSRTSRSWRRTLRLPGPLRALRRHGDAGLDRADRRQRPPTHVTAANSGLQVTVDTRLLQYRRGARPRATRSGPTSTSVPEAPRGSSRSGLPIVFGYTPRRLLGRYGAPGGARRRQSGAVHRPPSVCSRRHRRRSFDIYERHAWHDDTGLDGPIE